MNLNQLETSALRLAIARGDVSIKLALESFKRNLDESKLIENLRMAALKTIQETLQEQGLTIDGDEVDYEDEDGGDDDDDEDEIDDSDEDEEDSDDSGIDITHKFPRSTPTSSPSKLPTRTSPTASAPSSLKKYPTPSPQKSQSPAVSSPQPRNVKQSPVI